MTSSKISLFGANAFSGAGALSSKANNGMILYGHSTDGKSFLQKLDADSVDLVFPNGRWSFYAVSWHHDAPTTGKTGFMGISYCGKHENVNLTGVDAPINISLTNAMCGDHAFATNGPALTGGFKAKDFYTCQDISTISSGADNNLCDRQLKNNRGYITFIKLELPAYKNFGGGLEPLGNAISSCVEIDRNGMNGKTLSSLYMPDPNEKIQYKMKAYYTDKECDDSTGPDELLIDSKRIKYFSTANTQNIFLQANSDDLCKGNRLGIENHFAGGRGTKAAPYALCNPAQFNEIASDFSTNKTFSFELASDLDFNYGNFKPIGDPIDATHLSQVVAFTGSFYGNNHTIKNILLQGNSISNGSDLGFIRRIDGESSGAEIRDLTINKFATMGFESFDSVGILAGSANDVQISNIRVFGHAEGSSFVGGMIGRLSANKSNGAVLISNVHAEVDVNAKMALGHSNTGAGGLFGGILANPTTTVMLDSVSMHGQVNESGGNKYISVDATLYNNVTSPMDFYGYAYSYNKIGTISQKITDGTHYWLKLEGALESAFFSAATLFYGYHTSSPINGSISGPLFFSGVGGIVGVTSGAGSITIKNATARSDKIEGSKDVGGIIGKATHTTISNTTAEVSMRSNYWGGGATSGANIGGIVGSVYDSTVTYNLSMGARLFNSGDTTSGGAIGYSETSTTNDNYYVGPSNNTNGWALLPKNTGAFSKASYNNNMFYNFWGMGAPVSSATAAVNDTYYDLTSNRCYKYNSVWQAMPNCSSAWIMSADGNNFPRLAFELYAEMRVPYLKRYCTTNDEFKTTPITSADGGRIICKLSQLTQKSTSGPLDHLGQNIYYYSSTEKTNPEYTNADSNLAYRLNGHNNAIINYKTNADGLFETLTNGSMISNLKLIGHTRNAGTCWQDCGILAKVNFGTVQNVQTMLSTLNINPSSGSGFVTVGGLIGNNAGTISKGEIDTNIIISGPLTTQSGGHFNVGSIAGASSGKIEQIKANGSIYRNGFYSDLTYEFYGGVVGYVQGGSLNQIDSEARLSFNCSTSTQNVNAAPVYGISSSGDTSFSLSDFFVRANLYTSNVRITNHYNLFQTYGSITRGFVFFDQASVANELTNFTGSSATSPNIFYYYNGNSTDITSGFSSNFNFNNLTFRKSAAGVSYSNGANAAAIDFTALWNMGTDLVSSWNNNNTWRAQFSNGSSTSSNLPELVKTSGSFEQIGNGF